MSKIYLPTEFLNKSCYVVNNDYIRVYDSTNQYNNLVHDIYFKNDYYVRDSYSNFSSNTICVSKDIFTDSVFYRYDIDKIFILTFIFIILFFYFPYRIISRIAPRWLKF